MQEPMINLGTANLGESGWPQLARGSASQMKLNSTPLLIV